MRGQFSFWTSITFVKICFFRIFSKPRKNTFELVILKSFKWKTFFHLVLQSRRGFFTSPNHAEIKPLPMNRTCQSFHHELFAMLCCIVQKSCGFMLRYAALTLYIIYPCYNYYSTKTLSINSHSFKRQTISKVVTHLEFLLLIRAESAT